VCDGGQLEFICRITDMILEWRIILPAGHDHNGTNFSWVLTAYDQAPSLVRVRLSASSAVFTFSVVHSLPLFSSVLISPVINGTEVSCRDLVALNSSHSATISIINNSTGKLILAVSLSVYSYT
jgi:hypothetical protein